MRAASAARAGAGSRTVARDAEGPGNHVLVAHGAVAGEHDRPRAERRDPSLEGRRGRRRGRGDERAPDAAVVQRGEHLAALRVDPHGDERTVPGGPQRQPRRSRRARTPARRVRPRANASPCIAAMPMRRPVNDPGPATTARSVDLVEGDAGRGERAVEIARQPLTVGAARDRRSPRSARRRRAAPPRCRLVWWCREPG